MGHRAEAGSFYRLKNKEETNRKYLIGWGHRVGFVRGEKTQSGLVFVDSLAEYTAFLVEWSVTGTQKLFMIQVADTAQAGMASP